MRGGNANGFALMAVLWLLVVVGAVGIAFQADARAERRVVANTRSTVRAQWAARAGLHRTLAALDSILAVGRLGERAGSDLVFGPFEFTVNEVAVRVRVRDARARVNLNLADRGQLRALLVTAGLHPDRADALAAAVLDWRDPDGSRTPGGAEAGTYAAAQGFRSPRNAPFNEVGELRDVYGMTPELFGRVAPYLTVIGDGRINANTASIPVLSALPGIDLAAAQVMVRRRASWPLRNVFDLVGGLPHDAQDAVQADLARFTDAVAFSPGAVEIAIEASASNSPVTSRLWAHTELGGGASWRMVRVVER